MSGQMKIYGFEAFARDPRNPAVGLRPDGQITVHVPSQIGADGARELIRLLQLALRDAAVTGEEHPGAARSLGIASSSTQYRRQPTGAIP